MEISEWVVRALGVFWFAGGMLTVKACAEARVYDAFAAALSGRGWDRRERIRATTLAVGAVLTAASGVALIALDRAAPALMVVNALVQGAWVVYAPIAFPPEDDDDHLARRRVRNAFLIWSAATIVLIVAVASGTVTLVALPWVEVGIALAAVGAIAAQARGLLHGGMGRARETDTSDGDGRAWSDDDDPTEDARDPSDPIDPSIPRRWMIAPNIYTPPLRDVDTDETFHTNALPISDALAERIDDLDADVRAALSPSREDAEVFVLTPAARAAFEARIVALTEELKPIALDGEVTWWLPPSEEPA